MPGIETAVRRYGINAKERKSWSLDAGHAFMPIIVRAANLGERRLARNNEWFAPVNGKKYTTRAVLLSLQGGDERDNSVIADSVSARDAFIFSAPQEQNGYD